VGWESRNYCLEYLLYSYVDTWDYAYFAQYNLDYAITYLELDWSVWGKVVVEWLVEAVQRTIWALQSITQEPNYDYDPYFLMPYFLTHHTKTVDWRAIIEAWAYNEYEGAVPTIYTMDKMRRVAWDKPFLIPHALTPEEYEV
jgi:hypothetical protein